MRKKVFSGSVFSGSVFSVQGRSCSSVASLSGSGLKTENRKLKTSAGFTLLELLVVIAIIAILAGLILSTAGYIQKKGAMSRAEAEIAALSAALESYKADKGDYPTNANSGLTSNSLYGVLCPSNDAPDPKVYFEFSKGMTNTNGIVDPFGTVYYYTYPGDPTRNGTNFFDLFSTAGTSTNATTTNMLKWIKNW